MLRPNQDGSEAAAKPLAGRAIVLTRQRDRADEMAAAIVAFGGEPLICPMVETKPLSITEEYQKLLFDLDRFEWLIFTSANAVDAFHLWIKKNENASMPASLRIIAVGKKTADAIRDVGWRVDAIGAQATAEGVVEALIEYGANSKTSILFPRALDGREIIPQELEKIGAKVFVLPVYQTVPATKNNLEVLRTRLRVKTIDAVTFASPSAVRQFFRLLSIEEWPVLREICLAAIGPTTAAAIAELSLKVSVTSSTAASVDLIKAVANYFNVERVSLARNC